MNDYKPGDRITLQHDDGSKLVDRLIIGVSTSGKPNIETIGGDVLHLDELETIGWRVTDHKPKTHAEGSQREAGIRDVLAWIDGQFSHPLNVTEMARFHFGISE